MTTHSTAMSGLHQLDTEQTQFLQTLGIEVPALMTTLQMQNLLAQVQSQVACLDNDFIRGMAQDILAELRMTQGLQ